PERDQRVDAADGGATDDLLQEYHRLPRPGASARIPRFLRISGPDQFSLPSSIGAAGVLPKCLSADTLSINNKQLFGRCS
ncbi:hypothetical protein ABTK47_19800, partial [Acinetobacter baumannii]